MAISAEFEAVWKGMQDSIKQQMMHRAYTGSQELRTAAVDNVLKNQGGGRRYRVPSTKSYYTASAPGQPPANRTGHFRMSWHPNAKIGAGGSGFSVISEIENNVRVGKKGYLLGELLEDGTSRMAPRPHHDKIKEAALPELMKIYSAPYF